MTSGLLKNRTLESPVSAEVRPTSDKVRAAFFSSVGDAVEGSKFLDLFAGTGAVGIEAYSRGANHVIFFELKPDILKKNLKLLPMDSYTLIAGDIMKKQITDTYEVIYIDPPYGKYTPKDILKIISVSSLLAPGGIIAYEESSRNNFDCSDTGFSIIKERKYGDTKLVYLGV